MLSSNSNILSRSQYETKPSQLQRRSTWHPGLVMPSKIPQAPATITSSFNAQAGPFESVSGLMQSPGNIRSTTSNSFSHSHTGCSTRRHTVGDLPSYRSTPVTPTISNSQIQHLQPQSSDAHVRSRQVIARSSAAAAEAATDTHNPGHLSQQHSGALASQQQHAAAAAAAFAGLISQPSQSQGGGQSKASNGPFLVVFSGGTAFNAVAGKLLRLTTNVTHVLPVSDDGGSTAEVVRVLGGPAVGDIRSRCLRLADDKNTEARAVATLLGHRLPSGNAAAAKAEWHDIVEGEHDLWQGVSDPYKHVIRAFLVHFHHQILAHASEKFNFRNGSIGNFFFAGARTFFRSLEAAIFLFSRVARIPEGCTVLPAICTEERIGLGAELEDGTIIYGQNNISHPPASGSDASQVSKHDQEALPSPIRRIFYLSSTSHNTPMTALSSGGSMSGVQYPGSPGGTGGGLEVLPRAHPTAVSHLSKCDAVIYGCGSLYTSICPNICLEGMGETIAARKVPKILVLNGSHDRETSTCGAHDGPMTAADIVQAVSDALNRRRNRLGSRLVHPPSAYVTTVLVPAGGDVLVDRQALQLLGVQHVIEVPSVRDAHGRGVLYDTEKLVDAIAAVTRISPRQSVPEVDGL